MKMSSEKAVEVLSDFLLAFVAERDFDKTGVILEMAPSFLHWKCYLEKDGVRDRRGDFTKGGLMDQAEVAVKSLASAAETASGSQVWGMEFVLSKEGRYSVQFDYDKPNDFEEELVSIAPIETLTKRGADEEAAWEAYENARARHVDAWGLGKEDRWTLNMEEGKIRWIFADGRVVVANVQIIGTLNTQDGTFLWGWDHPSVPPVLRAAAEKMKDWGTSRSVPEAMTRKVSMDEFRAWVLTAVAMTLHGAAGAYRMTAGQSFVYAVFDEPSLE